MIKYSNASEFLPVVSAMANSIPVQYYNDDGEWEDVEDELGLDFSEEPRNYRIKPVSIEATTEELETSLVHAIKTVTEDFCGFNGMSNRTNKKADVTCPNCIELMKQELDWEHSRGKSKDIMSELKDIFLEDVMFRKNISHVYTSDGGGFTIARYEFDTRESWSKWRKYINKSAKICGYKIDWERSQAAKHLMKNKFCR